MESKSTVWLLGSNSERGFHSLYGGFCREGGDFLRVIKGGPGTGKSSFMRAVGRAAEEAGLAVEYIVCSGDPESLDGIYIPELRIGYVDGTSPHALDPAVFGAGGDYLNLGAYCETGAAYARREELCALTEGYRSWYARAYELLAAAAKASPAMNLAYVTDGERAAARARADSVAARELAAAPRGTARRRFLGSMTCAGRYLASGTLAALCRRLFLLDNRLGLGFEFARELAAEAERRGVEAVICPHWLRPELTEAVIIPALGVGWAALDPLAAYPEGHRRLHLARMADSETQRALRTQLREDERLYEKLLHRGGECLAAAKALHDRLEALYRPFVDFGALTRAAESEIRRVGL